MKKRKQILVLGVGNVIRGDDGIGIRLARRLKRILPSHFVIRELDTISLDLLELISGYSKVIFIDAIQTTCGIPGYIHHLSLQDLKYSSKLSSSHSINFRQIIELEKRLSGERGPQIEILAVESKRLNDFSERLSPELEEKFEKIIATVKSKIEYST
jgi:hydrogenase maturation protease